MKSLSSLIGSALRNQSSVASLLAFPMHPQFSMNLMNPKLYFFNIVTKTSQSTIFLAKQLPNTAFEIYSYDYISYLEPNSCMNAVQIMVDVILVFVTFSGEVEERRKKSYWGLVGLFRHQNRGCTRGTSNRCAVYGTSHLDWFGCSCSSCCCGWWWWCGGWCWCICCCLVVISSLLLVIRRLLGRRPYQKIY